MNLLCRQKVSRHKQDQWRERKWKDAGLQKQMKWASTEAGLRGWLRLFQVGHEPDVQHREDKNEMEELMEQPEGTQEHGI
jgi:hypothetical protein